MYFFDNFLNPVWNFFIQFKLSFLSIVNESNAYLGKAPIAARSEMFTAKDLYPITSGFSKSEKCVFTLRESIVTTIFLLPYFKIEASSPIGTNISLVNFFESSILINCNSDKAL